MSLTQKQLDIQSKKISSKKKEILEGLPHLYGFKWYSWALNFFESRNKLNLICAANQISKSSTQIRKAIDWATDTKKWKGLWPHHTPRQFWYLYPTKDVATTEFDEKWLPEFLPRHAFRHHAIYGWEVKRDSKGKIEHIRFNSGVTIYFKTYTQDVSHLQTGTVDAIFCDEELPEDLLSELNARLFSSDGYFHMVFTATLNQNIWLRAIEGDGDNELFPNAFKQQVSMYDCQHYTDGSLSKWTNERIQEIIASCKSEVEVQRRVHGRFIREEGRKYGQFSADRHFIKPFPIAPEWKVYAGVDIGSGGKENHPASISFVAVRPDYKFGVVFRGWRGDGIETTSGDILEKFKDLRGTLTCVLQIYDQQAKDFSTISTRIGEGFVKAEKSHEIGEDVINTLFKNDMLFIFDTDELRKLGSELTSLLKSTPKTKAKDDFCDSMRYAVTSIPWDWTGIQDNRLKEITKEIEDRPLTEKELLAEEIRMRRGELPKKGEPEGWNEMDEEFNYWNEQY